MNPEPASNRTSSSSAVGDGESPALPTATPAEPAPPWRPRASASHLSRAANGVFYLRLVIPDHVRRLCPELPREIRRSTKSTSKLHALRHARQICSQLVSSYNNAGSAMLVTESVLPRPPEGFIIEYADGRLRTDLYRGASAEVRRLYMHLVEVATGFGAADPSAPPPGSLDRVAVVNAPAPSATAAAQAAPAPADPAPVGGMEWLSDAIRDWRTNGPHTFGDHTWVHAYRPSFRVFRELVGNTRRDITNDDGELECGKLDIRLRELTADHMRQFHDLLKQLPQRQGQRDDGIEALDLILEADAQEKAVKKLGESRRPRQSLPNIVKKFDHLAPAIKYMRKNEWISTQASDKFELERDTASSNEARPRKHTKEWKPGALSLLKEELRQTFESSAYIDGAIQCAWKYWIPPLLLTTGARVSEVAQLHTNDIVEVLGIPCISFVWDSHDEDDGDEGLLGNKLGRAKSEEEFRRLKNSASRRIIPIHPELLRLGFMEWVEQRRSTVGPKPGLLFFGLKWEQKSGYGRKPSQYVLSLLKASGVWRRRKKVCHSLRATCMQELRRVGMPEDERHRYVGHSTGSQEETSYSETEQGPNCPAQKLLRYLKKTKFDVTFPTYAKVCEMRAKRGAAEQQARAKAAAQRRLKTSGAVTGQEAE